MKFKTLSLVIIFVIGSVLIVGCKKKEEPMPTKMTAAEAIAEAEKAVNSENLDAEMEKMEKEINSDTE